MHTPWGESDDVKEVKPGISFVSTPRHGGYKLDRQRNKEMPKAFRKPGGWYEEDCEYAKVHLHFGIGDTAQAVQTVKNWFPEQYEAVFGVKVTAAESMKVAKTEFFQKNINNWVTVSACGDWHPNVPKGMVGVTACIGGRNPNTYQYHTPEMKCFLVPATEYDKREESFVIDLARHQEIPSL